MSIEGIKPIKVPVLGAGTIDIHNTFENIDKNFGMIMDSEYLKGCAGNSVILETVDLLDSEYIDGLKEAVSSQWGQNQTPKDINGVSVLDMFKVPGKITLIYEVEDGKNILISSLPYIFKDLRFEEISAAKQLDEETDWSCAIYYKDGQWVPVQEFPTLYYENGFKWKINGVKTGLDAQGPKGDPGQNGSLHVVLVELDGSYYKITHILDQNLQKEVPLDKPLDNTYDTPIKICEYYGIKPKKGAQEASVVVAIAKNGNINESFIAPVFSLQDDMYVYCTENNMICEVSHISGSEMEKIFNDVMGDIDLITIEDVL